MISNGYSENIFHVLQDYFDYSTFRPGQQEAIESLLSGTSTLAVMPTGGGKSLCYQIPALILPGVTLVISPLISLMKDQVDKLKARNIPVGLINSTISVSEASSILQEACEGKIKLLYIAPERFNAPSFRDALKGFPISLFAVDEAHCISQWGHDFRPSYLRLRLALSWCGNPIIGAFTATATPTVRDDIVFQLGMQKPKVIVSGFDRPNLKYLALLLKDRDKKKEMTDIIKKINAPTIVYCSTKKNTDEITEHLQEHGIRCGAYHGGLDSSTRTDVQTRFIEKDLPVIVATNAFGMGIDKPDVRLIIHYNMPGSIEAYYQESGRAGRDGKTSYCLLLGNKYDLSIQEYLIEASFPTPAIVQNVYRFLFSLPENPILRTYKTIAEDMPENLSEVSVGSAIKILESAHLLQRLSEKNHPAYVCFSLPFERLLQRNLASPARCKILNFFQKKWPLLALNQNMPIRLEEISQETGLEKESLFRHLRKLSEAEGFRYTTPFSGRGLQKLIFLKEGDPLPIDFEKIEKNRNQQLSKLQHIHDYVLTRSCRRRYLLNYFGENWPHHSCGACDLCLNWRAESRYLKSENSKNTALKEKSKVSHPPTIHKVREMSSSDFETFYHCILKYNNKIGLQKVIEILRGSQNADLQRMHLDQCSFHGRLTHISKKTLADFFSSEKKQGFFLKTRSTQFPKIGITDKGKEKLKNFVDPSRVSP
jgi:ATP-dependent DNA helicase RecQ